MISEQLCKNFEENQINGYLTLSTMDCVRVSSGNCELKLDCQASPDGEIEVGFFKAENFFYHEMKCTGVELNGTFALHGYDIQEGDDVLCTFSGKYDVYTADSLLAFVKW